MLVAGTFTKESFDAADVAPAVEIQTGLPVGVATMEKRYEGAVDGRSATVFTAAFDQAAGVGTYLAMESFECALDGRTGSFNFVHSATMTGADRTHLFFLIVPSSGTANLTGITGGGELAVDPDGTHRIHFDYELPASS